MQGSGLQAARDLRDVRARLLLGGTGPGARGGGGAGGALTTQAGGHWLFLLLFWAPNCTGFIYVVSSRRCLKP